MSSYENAVGGKLKLKGKALDVKAGAIKKKKKHKKRLDDSSLSTDGKLSSDHAEGTDEANKIDEKEQAASCDDHLTPAERRYIEQRERIDNHRLAKTADKSHRDRIQDFNQYLANLSEHYDIPKVGPG